MRKKVIAFVPIKLNSQRLPHKNILPFGEQPLSWHIFQTLLGVDRIDEICVFCSEERIMDYLPPGVKLVKRNPRLDGDLVQGNEIYESFIQTADADYYILAHTTAPFLKRESVENALMHVLHGDYDSALTVQKKQTFAWYGGKPLNYEVNDIPRTQDIEPVYIETSGFYLFTKEHFLNHRRRIGFKPYFQVVDDIEGIDIDTKADYEFALRMLDQGQPIRG